MKNLNHILKSLIAFNSGAMISSLFITHTDTYKIYLCIFHVSVAFYLYLNDWQDN